MTAPTQSIELHSVGVERCFNYLLPHCLTSSCSASRFFASAALARAALLFRAFFDGDLMEGCRPSSGERPIVAAARLLVPAASTSTSTSTSSSVWRARFAAFLGASAAAPAAAAASGQLPAHHGQLQARSCGPPTPHHQARGKRSNSRDLSSLLSAVAVAASLRARSRHPPLPPLPPLLLRRLPQLRTPRSPL